MSNRSVSVGGNVQGSPIITGDGVFAEMTMTDLVSAAAPTNDLNAVVSLLSKVNGLDPRALELLSEATAEMRKPDADRSKVGTRLDEALKLAKVASGFFDVSEKLLPRLASVVAWLSWIPKT